VLHGTNVQVTYTHEEKIMNRNHDTAKAQAFYALKNGIPFANGRKNPETSKGWNSEYPEHGIYLVARVIREKINNKHGGITVGGCGMDMGFHVVYSLSSYLYRDGFECIGDSEGWGKKCPSNDHCNDDRNYTPHHHQSGGYALRQRWM